MFAKKELSVYIERKRIKHKKSVRFKLFIGPHGRYMDIQIDRFIDEQKDSQIDSKYGQIERQIDRKIDDRKIDDRKIDRKIDSMQQFEL